MDILDDLILGPAKHGHLDRLIEFLEGGHEPTVEMRKFIAKVLREVPKSRLKKGSKGVERSDITYRDMEIAVFVESLEEDGLKVGAIKKAAEEYGVERHTVDRALKKHRGRWPRSFLAELDRIPLVSALTHGRCIYCASATEELERFRKATCPHCDCPRGFLKFDI